MPQGSQMNQKPFKVPKMLSLGAILPGQYGECILPLESTIVCFLNLELSKKSIEHGFFMVKQGSNDCKTQMNLVLKPGKKINLCVASYCNEVNKSTTFYGQLNLAQRNLIHVITLAYRVEIPRILCKKMLEDNDKQKIVRLIINKAVTNQTRLMLFNEQEYELNLEVGLLQKQLITEKKNPFILKVHHQTIKAQAKEQFIVPFTLSTNIGYKNDFKGFKKVVFRNIITLKTNSVLVWCIPLELVVVFNKQPQIKQ